ncbi:MAG: tetrahydrofolate dehydrogenase/cyclohydrolase catalytic domain-containing protein, partial [Phycisphaerae bacterium]
MPASIIDGKAVAEEIRTSIAAEAEEMTRSGRPPKLVAVQVGEDPASKLYTDMQARQCESAGLVYELMNLPEDISQDGLAAAIGKLNSDVSVSGLILQMPLPDHLDASEAQLAIAPEKDVEGIHPVNLGRLFSGTAFVYPCTPLAAVELLTRTCDDLNGKEAVIVGR